MVITEKLKDSLRKFMSSRAAAGEGSLKTWGGMQKPPITGSMAEAVADALVKDKVLTKEERASGWVWRNVLGTAAPVAPVAAVNDDSDEEQDEEDEGEDEEQDEDEETDDQADDEDEEEEEAPPSAPSAAPVAQPAPARRNASVTPAPAPAPAAPVEASAPPAALAYSPELVAFVLGLPDAQWSALAATRAAVYRARALRAQSDALEAEAIKALDRALSGSPEAAAPAPAAVAAAAAAVQALDAIEGRPPPAGWARTRTVDTGENAGTARDKILRLFMASPEKRMRASEVAAALGWSARVVSGPLCTLTRDEKLERPDVGVYCLAKALARKVALCAPSPPAS